MPSHKVAGGIPEEGEEGEQLVEVEVGTRTLILRPVSAMQGEIVRLVSSDPADYMNPAWQPGRIVALPVG